MVEYLFNNSTIDTALVQNIFVNETVYWSLEPLKNFVSLPIYTLTPTFIFTYFRLFTFLFSVYSLSV